MDVTTVFFLAGAMFLCVTNPMNPYPNPDPWRARSFDKPFQNPFLEKPPDPLRKPIMIRSWKTDPIDLENLSILWNQTKSDYEKSIRWKTTRSYEKPIQIRYLLKTAVYLNRPIKALRELQQKMNVWKHTTTIPGPLSLTTSRNYCSFSVAFLFPRFAVSFLQHT